MNWIYTERILHNNIYIYPSIHPSIYLSIYLSIYVMVTYLLIYTIGMPEACPIHAISDDLIGHFTCKCMYMFGNKQLDDTFDYIHSVSLHPTPLQMKEYPLVMLQFLQIMHDFFKHLSSYTHFHCGHHFWQACDQNR